MSIIQIAFVCNSLYMCFQMLWVRWRWRQHSRETQWPRNNCTVYIRLSAWLHRYVVVVVNREEERHKNLSLSLCPCGKWVSLVPRQQECPGNWVLKLSKIQHDIIEGDQFTAHPGDTLSHTLSHTHTHQQTERIHHVSPYRNGNGNFLSIYFPMSNFVSSWVCFFISMSVNCDLLKQNATLAKVNTIQLY